MAVVAAGNPDTATYIAILAPGIDNNLGTMDVRISRAQTLAASAQELLLPPERACAIAWLGYDPPQGFSLDAAASMHARDGGQALSTFVYSLRTQEEPPRRLTVEGHSYGSVVVGEAASSAQGLSADDIIVVGSPGMGVQAISQLRINPQHAWAGAAAGDRIVNNAGGLFFGPPPTATTFGANRFTVDTNGHVDYWKPGSMSLRNQASIIAGNYTDVKLDWGTCPP